MRIGNFGIMYADLILCSLALSAQSPEAMVSRPAETAKFASNRNFPSCGVGARQDGSDKGPIVILIRLKAGCVLSWHWHTSNERLIMISGSAKAEMKDMPPTTMKQGDYLMMPSQQIHQFTAMTSVEFFDISDTAFDIHYVDADGKEISVDAALKRSRK